MLFFKEDGGACARRKILDKTLLLSGQRCAVTTLFFILFFGEVGAAFSYPQEAQLHSTVASGTYGEGKPFCTPLFSVVVIIIVIVIVIVVRCWR